MVIPDPVDIAHGGLQAPRELVRPAGTMRYVDQGSGPAVVCVHGNPTWSLYFRGLAAALAVDHRVILPDHLGMGRSDVPDPARYGYDLAARVADLGALLDHLAIGVERPATLVVHDWGGAIALTWAARHPERVGRVVLLNTAAFPLLPGHGLPWLLRLARLPWVGPALVCGGNVFVRAALRLGVRRRPLAPAVRRAYLAPHRSWRSRQPILRFVRDIPTDAGQPTHTLLAATGAGLGWLADRPTMLVWGARDPVLTPAYLDEWRRRLPDAETHVIDDAGHLVLEDAAEVVPLVVAFLARTRAEVAAR